MNKNLKKVISSVVAFGLSLSSLSAFAATYTDVAETAEYATAVNELSALGIVNGYEDGTFKPNDKVTRAEVTKMVVAALAQTQAADSAKGATMFSDVAADHWASGFINIGASTTGFINGMGDGTFRPEGNVTYAQLVKMLVTALGYGGMALQEGGYPTGYIAVGDRIGVTKSVIANANDELTRGQVAILIDNSMNLPLLVTTIWSAANPEYEIKDGKGDQFQTLLTDYHDTYKVEGKITETSKSGNVDPGEAKFEIAVADRFGDDDYFTRNDGRDADERTETVKVAEGIDATENLFAYSTALIHKNDDDEYELISISSTAKSKTVELDAGAFDDENSAYKNDPTTKIQNFDEQLKYYSSDAKTGKVTDYKLADGNKTSNVAQLWVNGVQIGDIGDVDDSNIETYLVNNEIGKVTLVDAPQEGKATTDGYYDYVLVTYYKSAIVSDVQSNGTVYFDTKEAGLPSSVKFDKDDVENGDLEYDITLDGKQIDFTDLQEDDVIAIAYDVTEDFKDSQFYDVFVTRGTVEGKITSNDTENSKYTVNGTKYKYDEDNLSEGTSKDAVGMEATLYVDAFGRIVKLEETSSSKKYAIAENVWHEDGPDVDYVKLILPDGSVKDYEIKNDDVEAVLENVVFNGKAKNDIQDRVVTYKVNSSNQVYNVVSQSAKAEEISEEYTAKTNKVGSVKLSDSSKIIDASDYIDTGKVADLNTVKSLVDDTKYTAYGFDKLSDNTYAFVIITDGIGGYSDDTQLAVVVKTSRELDSEGDDKPAVTVLFEGKEQTFVIDELNTEKTDSNYAVDDVDDLNKGDVIIFKRNSSDEITRIDLIASMGINNGTKRIPYDAEDLSDVVAHSINKWKTGGDADSDIELDYGVVTDKDSKTVTLTPFGGRDADAEDYDLSDDTLVYVYDYTEGSSNALFVGTKADIVKTSIGKSFKDGNDNVLWEDVLDDSTMAYSINYALIRTEKDDVKEIFIVVAPGDED